MVRCSSMDGLWKNGPGNGYLPEGEIRSEKDAGQDHRRRQRKGKSAGNSGGCGEFRLKEKARDIKIA